MDNVENNMDNNQGQQTNGQDNGQGQQEKLFTQDDVNRIVGERLARARGGQDMNQFAERERGLNQRELMLDAREKLADAGLPKELLNAINCSSREAMENSIKVLTAFKGNTAPNDSRKTYVVSTGVTGNSGGSGNFRDNEIRKAMGLTK